MKYEKPTAHYFLIRDRVNMRILSVSIPNERLPAVKRECLNGWLRAYTLNSNSCKLPNSITAIVDKKLRER